MPTTTEVQQKRRQLVADGVDPFLLLAEVLTDNDRLRAQVERLQLVVRGTQSKSTST